VDTDYRSGVGSAFLEAQFAVDDRVILTPGLRADHESLSKETTVDPRLSAVFELTENVRLRAAAGTYHQYPEPPFYDENIGNPGLGPMAAIHYIGGAEYRNERDMVRVEVYHKEYDRLLLEDDSLNYVNEGYGYAKGADVFLKKGLGRFNGWISYSYLMARRKEGEFTELTSPDFDITHNLTAILNLEASTRFHMGTSFRCATGKPYTPYFNQHNTRRVPRYVRLDLNLTYLHTSFPGTLTVFYLAVSNLLDRINVFDYRYSSDYSQREPVESSFGRSVYFGVSFSL